MNDLACSWTIVSFPLGFSYLGKTNELTRPLLYLQAQTQDKCTRVEERPIGFVRHIDIGFCIQNLIHKASIRRYPRAATQLIICSRRIVIPEHASARLECAY